LQDFTTVCCFDKERARTARRCVLANPAFQANLSRISPRLLACLIARAQALRLSCFGKCIFQLIFALPPAFLFEKLFDCLLYQ
jgi:hypothetical protein